MTPAPRPGRRRRSAATDVPGPVLTDGVHRRALQRHVRGHADAAAARAGRLDVQRDRPVDRARRLRRPEVPGLGFRYDTDERWALPNPTGREGVFTAFTPPHFPDLR